MKVDVLGGVKMDLKPKSKTITQFLSSRCQFSIPRFQREYSWEKRNYREFIDDMIACLRITDKAIYDSPYFLGTMLFIGNLEMAGQTLLNIGNLILLEINLNNAASHLPYNEKRDNYYLKSNYDWVKNFVSNHLEWTEDDIVERADKMANIYYHEILRKE